MQRTIGRALLSKFNWIRNYSSFEFPGKMLTLSIDGNISSGKSTLLNNLLGFFPKSISSPSKNDSISPIPVNIEVIKEPLEKWCNLEGHNLLDMFYKDPVKNNFMFQHYVQLTRVQDMLNSTKKNDDKNNPPGINIKIMERSLQNNRYCFLELARKSGSLSEVEFSVLSEWFQVLSSTLPPSLTTLSAIIYLQTDPLISYERMRGRGRGEETSIPLQYITHLHQAYEEWLVSKKTEDRSETHVIVIDANESEEKVAQATYTQLLNYFKTLNTTQ